MLLRLLTLTCCTTALSFANETTTPTTANQEKSATIKAEPFEVKITIHNGHLGQVFMKVADKGTDKYDRGLDDMAPPPGMNTGYTALVSPDMKHYLYRDTRGINAKNEWIFFADVFKDKPVTINWSAKELPANYQFKLIDGNNKVELDMKKVETYTVKAKAAFKLVSTFNGEIPVKATEKTPEKTAEIAPKKAQ